MFHLLLCGRVMDVTASHPEQVSVIAVRTRGLEMVAGLLQERSRDSAQSALFVDRYLPKLMLLGCHFCPTSINRVVEELVLFRSVRFSSWFYCTPQCGAKRTFIVQ